MAPNTEREQELNKHWRTIKLLQKLEEQNKKGDNFFLLDGPPYANFTPHVGHIRNTVYKDLYLRLAFMQGKNTYFQPGFDTHGLPVENRVEKEMKLESKKDIEKMGVTKFMKTCKDLSATNKDLWIEVYDLLGSWYSWREPYLTYKNSYIQSGWWTFQQWYKKGLVYEKRKPGFWCPRCETSLAGYEVTDSYKILRDPSIFVKFKVKGKDEYLLVFTTTPWTLLSNVAITALGDADYVKIETSAGVLILAKERLEIFEDMGIGFKLLEEFKGKELDGLEYEPLLDVPQQKEIAEHPKSHKVYMSIPILKERVASKVATKKNVTSGDVFEEFVTTDDGTGLVHTAPGHGKTDNELGKHYGLFEASPLDEQSKFTEMGGEFEGKFVKDADKEILERLDNEGKLLYSTTAEHKYPVCWRCKSPLIFQMSTQWFVNIKKARDLILKLNEKQVKWLPEFARERFLTWVANAEDWNISRQRYWGIPIPVWKCECGEVKIIGSKEELAKNAAAEVPEDLHTVNDVKLNCKCGKEMERINDIFDVWFDSGIAPWASMGYPFENKELFEANFPVSRINEALDQVRGWFYSLAMCSALTFDKPAYETVSMTGWTLDDKGEKMSKSLGNVIFAKEALEEMGADVLRFGMCWDIAPYNLQKFNKEMVKKDIGRIVNTLSNLRNLLLTSQTVEKGELQTEDKWILSKLNSVIKDFTSNLDSFELNTAARQIGDFIVEDLSRNYVQLVRERMNEGDSTVYYVINESLLTLVKLLAPIMPFITEDIYLSLDRLNDELKESVHLEKFPESDKKMIDSNLEAEMGSAQAVMQGILAAREKMSRGVRWPVKNVTVLSRDENVKKAAEGLQSLIKIQTNVKEIEVKEQIDESETELSVNKSKVGQDFKKDSPEVMKLLTKEVLEEIHSKGKAKAGKFKVTTEHINVKETLPENLVAAEFKGGMAYLDTELDDELEREGYAREVTRRIQEQRKELGLQKSDKIEVAVISEYDLSSWGEELKSKVGANEIYFEDKKFKNKVKLEVKEQKFEIQIKTL